MVAKTPHRIKAETPVMLLTLVKQLGYIREDS